MKRAAAVLLVLLGLSSGAWAQGSVGVPGYNTSIFGGAHTWPGTQTFYDSAFVIKDNTTPTKIFTLQLSGLTAGTNVFNLNSGSATTFSLMTSTLATNAPEAANSVWGESGALAFEGSAADGNETRIQVTNPGGDIVFTIPAFTGTALISSTANEPDTSNSFWVNTGELKFEGSTADANETTVGVVDPTAARTIYFPNLSGTVQLQESGFSALSPYTLIQGGFTLDGTATIAVAETVTVTVVDTTPSITDGDVQVCGYINTSDQTALKKTCETIDFSGGAAATPTAATFIEITNIKASSFATLGGAGDETIAAAWTVATTSILGAVNLTNSAASDFVSTPVTVASHYGNPICLDLQGCSWAPGAVTQDGFELFVVGRASTNPITVTTSATLLLSGEPFVMRAGDVLHLIYSLADTKWNEVSRDDLTRSTLAFEGTTSDANQTTLTVTQPTADRTVTFQDASGTVLLSTTANEFDTSNSLWANTGALVFEGSSADANETTVGVINPTAARAINFPNDSGTVQLTTSGPSVKSFYTLIEGGYTLNGTTTASPASTVKVTVVDTTPSITDGDIQVCGYENTTNQTALLKTCDTLDFSGGAGNQTTADSFIEVTNIKSSSLVGLGGGGDETVAAEFTTGAVSIRSATNLVNSTKSNFVGTVTTTEKFWAPKCLDLAGCDVEPGAASYDGFELTILGRLGTAVLTFTDSGNMALAGGAAFAMDVSDVLKLVYTTANAQWAEVGRANN